MTEANSGASGARKLLLSATVFALTTMLTGCITVNVPEPTESTSAARPSPSATTFTAEPRETEEEQEQTQEPEPTQATQTREPEPEPEPEPEQISQDVEFSISGGCQDSYEQVGYYGIFEEFGDDCYLIVEVFPPQPARFAELQYFNSTWEMESSGMTDRSGIVYLEVDQYCDDGYWCDGIWDYRVFVEAEGSLPSERSITFELDFIPWY